MSSPPENHFARSTNHETTALMALYDKTWSEITRLRDYEWKIAYYFVYITSGLIALVATSTIQMILTDTLRWILTIAQIVAMFFAIYYLDVTHGHLTQQRNFRRGIEEYLRFYDDGVYGAHPVLPREWKGLRITKAFERLGLVVPLISMVVLTQIFSIYILWGLATRRSEMHRDVAFRHVEFRTEKGAISGFCLSYPTKEAAIEAGAILRRYITSKGVEKNSHVECRRQPSGGYSVAVVVSVGDQTFKVEIDEVDSQYIHQLNSSLSRFTYYPILIGYMEGESFKLLRPRDFHLFKRDLVVDGRIVLGKTGSKIDWDALFDAEGA